MHIEPTAAACGARVTAINLSAPLDPKKVAQIRAAWLEHLVLIFPEQTMDDDALERFAIAMGGLYADPFLTPVPGRTHVAAIKREADELSPVFADGWHSDWSFEKTPPAGTCLFAIDVPPTGGDTLFANQHLAWEELPVDRKAQLADKVAIHSAKRGFARNGMYGDKDAGRSMDIRPSDKALATQNHPLVLQHPETGRPGIFSTWGYILGIEGMKTTEAAHLLVSLQRWQVQDRFVYRHHWEPGTLVLWDNRSTIHRATGGYEGYRRLAHRITIAPPPGSASSHERPYRLPDASMR